jgi:hypothetical protein
VGVNVTDWSKVLSEVLSEPAKVQSKSIRKMLGQYELVTEEDVSRHELYLAVFVNGKANA